MTTAHTAIVTGANHGIGAATATTLARRGCSVLATYLRVDDPDDPGTPQAYRDHRAQDAATVIARITARDRAAPSGFRLCGVEFSRPNAACAISRASVSARSESTWRRTPTHTSTY